jgi:CDGSH-type Zn-finger protein
LFRSSNNLRADLIFFANQRLVMEFSMSETRINATVTVTRDGPYIVSGNVPLQSQTIVTNAAGDSESWLEGEPFRTAEKYALCRCGRSANKPFCDGTHAKIGFDGTETASRARYLDQASGPLHSI